jgi:NADH:ubiquinone oxidoreductase subunit K
MALPITHYLYLALALFTVGLGGALLRRSLVTALLGIQLMLVSAALLLSAYARLFLDLGGQLAAIAVVLVGLVELAIAAAVVLRLFAAEAGDDGLVRAGWLHDWTGRGGSKPGGPGWWRGCSRCG